MAALKDPYTDYTTLAALSKWPNKNKNKHNNVSLVLGSILYKARRSTAAELKSLTNNAAIILDPLGHKPPANKYKGFMQRYGRLLSYGRKRTIVSKAPFITNVKNYAKRFPNKLGRVMTSKPPDILAQHFFPKGPRPVKYLGGGADGKVYTTSDGRAMKFILGNAPQEYTALHNLQRTGLVPSFQNGNGKVSRLFPLQQNAARKMFGRTSHQMTALIMGKVGGSNPMTLGEYAYQYQWRKNKRANIAQRLRSAVNTLSLKGISHGNMHKDNIIVEADRYGHIRHMWLIDFGRSSKIPITETARTMLATSENVLRGRSKTYKTHGLYGNVTNVPIVGIRQTVSRIDPHMFRALTGTVYSRANEAQIQNYRKLIAGMKNRPSVKTPVRRAKSASPSRNTSNTPRGSPKSTRASPRRSLRPRSAV